MLNYGSYLKLDSIIDSVEPQTNFHDEILFITIHQVYEIWFRHILAELDAIIQIFNKEKIEDNSNDIFKSVHLLVRINEIWKILIDQINILETMTPLDFLDFRHALYPASGFQSLQFKIVEAKIGLVQRFEADFYKKVDPSGLTQEQRNFLDNVEKNKSLRTLVINWLIRLDEMFKVDIKYIQMWKSYRNSYFEMVSKDKDAQTLLEHFDKITIFDKNFDDNFPNSAYRALLLINMLRDYPLFQKPFEFIIGLSQLDENISIWRFRHLTMVMRMIGKRVGTGGHSKDYLEGTLTSNKFFREFGDISSFLISRQAFSTISTEYKAFFDKFALGFNSK